MTLGGRIKLLRENCDLSLEQLANKLGISKSILWSYEKNKSIPSAEIVKRLAIFFDVSADYLLFDESEKEDISISDNKLLAQFKKVEKLKAKDKEYIMNVITYVLEKDK